MQSGTSAPPCAAWAWKRAPRTLSAGGPCQYGPLPQVSSCFRCQRSGICQVHVVKFFRRAPSHPESTHHGATAADWWPCHLSRYLSATTSCSRGSLLLLHRSQGKSSESAGLFLNKTLSVYCGRGPGEAPSGPTVAPAPAISEASRFRPRAQRTSPRHRPGTVREGGSMAAGAAGLAGTRCAVRAVPGDPASCARAQDPRPAHGDTSQSRGGGRV